MKSIDNFFRTMKKTISEFGAYIQARRLIRRYEQHKPPYDSSDYRNGATSHKIVEAYTTTILFKN